jgi:hypothetical protein
MYQMVKKNVESLFRFIFRFLQNQKVNFFFFCSFYFFFFLEKEFFIFADDLNQMKQWVAAIVEASKSKE